MIAFIPETSGVEVWDSAEVSAATEAERLGIKLYWNAPSRADDVQSQISLMREVMKRHPIGLILGPGHPRAVLSTIRNLMDARIPVVAVRSPVSAEPSSTLSFVITDENRVGELLADRASLGRGAVLITGYDHSERSEKRIRSTISRLRQRGHFAVVAISDAQGSIVEEEQALKGLLKRFPEVKAVIALNLSALRGAWSTRRAGFVDPSVRLIGCDREMDIARGIRLSEIDSVILENTGEMAKIAVRILSGADVSRKGQTTLVPPVLIDRANLDSVGIQNFLSLASANR